MTRGYSLERDLRSLINNPKYSDIEILCGDEKKLYGCRAILAARSEVFDRLLYNGMKESFERQISFPNVNSPGMNIILEYTYTGSIKKKSLSVDNIIEAFYAADYFQLPNIQDFIIETVKNANYKAELLSRFVDFADIMPLSEDNILLNLLVEELAATPLNTIEFGRLSIEALQYFLSCTHEKDEPFVTPEYEVFRYSAVLAAKQISNDAYRTLMECLPTLEQIGDSVRVENKFITDHQRVVKELEPLIKFIDFRLINVQILADIIRPLEILPTEIISNIYQHKELSKNPDLNNIRGTLYYWDKSACGSKLIIEDKCRVVRASSDCDSYQSVRAKMLLDNEGIFEWDIIIEKDSDNGDDTYVGVCASENFDYEDADDFQSTEWVLGSDGSYYNSKFQGYCASSSGGTKITVHLDMNKRSCAFTVGGIRYPVISEWGNLPSKLYPVVSLCYPCRIRIQPHQKLDC